MSFAAITLFIVSQRVFIVVSVYFVIDSFRKLLDTPSYITTHTHTHTHTHTYTHTHTHTCIQYLSINYTNLRVQCVFQCLFMLQNLALYITNSTEDSPSDANSHSVGQGIPRLILNLQIRYRFRKSPLLVPILNQIKPFNNFAPYSWKT
jgi:hypothetical protein